MGVIYELTCRFFHDDIMKIGKEKLLMKSLRTKNLKAKSGAAAKVGLNESVWLSAAILVALFCFAGCSRSSALGFGKSDGPDLKGKNGVGGSEIGSQKPRISPVQSALLGDGPSGGACQVLQTFAESKVDLTPKAGSVLAAGRTKFSIFRVVEGIFGDLSNEYRGEYKGEYRAVENEKMAFAAMEVSESPYVQFYLGGPFKVDSPEDFYNKAQEEYRSGRLSQADWAYLNMVKMSPILFRATELEIIDSQLEEMFPGIFGMKKGLATSLPWVLAKRVHGWEQLAFSDVVPILTKRTDLFHSCTWVGVVTDVRTELRAAIANLTTAKEGAQETATDNEKQTQLDHLCEFVLWQRSMAQLLSLKGYNRPIMVQSRSSSLLFELPRLSGLTAESFELEDHFGSFYDAETDMPAIVSDDALAAYDPDKHPLLVRSDVPGSVLQSAYPSSDVDSLLGFLESVIYHYEATSPAAPWFQSGYILGDIEGESKSAILPIEIHAVALGLVNMGFKNLSQFNLQPLNADGGAVKSGEKAAGILLIDRQEIYKNVAVLKASRVAKLIRSVVYLDQALDQFVFKVNGTPDGTGGGTGAEGGRGMPRGREDTKRRNRELDALKAVGYDSKKLAMLLGDALFSSAELEKLLTESERNGVLKVKLNALYLPLIQLASQLKFDAEGSAGCIAEMKWDLVTGERTPVKNCDKKLTEEFLDAVHLLGQRTQLEL